MNNSDFLQRFLFEPAPVRGEIVHLHASYQAIIHLHPYSDKIRHLLGEALVVVSLLSSIIKWKGRVTLQFSGKGQIKLLMAQCTQDLHLRGLVQCGDIQTDSELEEALSVGTLAIMMDPDLEGGKRYQGIVAWERGSSLTQAIEEYFRLSEQIPTRLWLAIDENSAAGLLLQALPKEKSELFQNEWEHLVHLTHTIQPKELLTLAPRTLLKRLYVEEDIRLFEPDPVIFRCTCSIKRSENAMRLLGEAEVDSELKDKQKIVVTCEFCNKEYMFDRVDVAKIFKTSDGSGNYH